MSSGAAQNKSNRATLWKRLQLRNAPDVLKVPTITRKYSQVHVVIDVLQKVEFRHSNADVPGYEMACAHKNKTTEWPGLFRVSPV